MKKYIALLLLVLGGSLLLVGSASAVSITRPPRPNPPMVPPTMPEPVVSAD